MAKKQPAAKKSAAKKPVRKKSAPRRSAKKTANKGNYGLLIVLILALICIGLFALYQLKDLPTSDDTPVASQNESPSPEQEKTAPMETTRPQGSKENADPGIVKESPERNKELPVNKESNAYYYTSSFDFAWPKYSLDDQIVEHSAYSLAYSEETEQAIWVSYKLTASHLKETKVSRSDNFAQDPAVTSGSASLDDYRRSGYDRGHLAPAADFKWSEVAMDECFLMGNICPQNTEFNRGIWLKLEEQVREWTLTNNELFIVTGPIIGDKPKRIGKNKVAVPEAFYKVILDISEPEIKAIGFIMPNVASSSDIMFFAASIDDIEEITGLDFFPLIPDALEAELESSINKYLWQ